MSECLALITGSTGFLGQKFLSALLNAENCKYSDIILVGRENNCVSAYGGETFNIKDLPIKKTHLFHFATLYNPKPKNFDEIDLIVKSNIMFPLEVMKATSGVTDVYCIQSYQELLPVHLQNEYSLSKRLFTNSLKSCGIRACEFYLFDNFGINDKRGKVVDKFIDNALAGYDLNVPMNDVRINLCVASNIIENILNLIDSEGDKYFIGNKEMIGLSELAHFIISETNSRSKVKSYGCYPDTLKYIEEEITNITGYDNDALYGDLVEHIHIKKATSL